jgi:hypothetical protein
VEAFTGVSDGKLVASDVTVGERDAVGVLVSVNGRSVGVLRTTFEATTKGVSVGVAVVEIPCRKPTFIA